MSLQRMPAEKALERMVGPGGFSTIIDARSEGEFALDHLPGAVNWPSLNDQQRIVIGTMFKEKGGFEAQKLGAAWVAVNIARHIEREVLSLPKTWQPLIYCWRGGKRSGALSMVLGQIGFQVTVLEGGYKAFRAAMLAWLDRHMAHLRFVVVCGTTGSGKTRLLHALQRQGAQVLDLEALACHRSSVLGRVPGVEQPSQKSFDMQIWHVLRQMDPQHPIFVEAESRKVGNLTVMDVLMDAMRDSPCIDLQLPQSERVALLMEEYPLFVSDTLAFAQRLDALINLKGKAVVDAWKDALAKGDVSSVVHSLLETHYDPTYLKSISRNFKQHTQAQVVSPRDRHHASFDELAQSVLASHANVT
jgi:tRNA 2-selenouridine synthase